MKSQEQCLRLAEAIREIFRNGLTLSKDVLHYIDSTFANPSVAEIEAIFRDESDCEKDSLLELIFFPDESLQMQLEDILEQADFYKEDEAEIREFLLRQLPETRLYFPANMGSLKLLMPDWLIESFLSRLNICKKADKRLTEAINVYTQEKYAKLFKVRLRNTRFTQTENKVLFLCRFFEKAENYRIDISEHLNFALNFLDELWDDRDIYQSLKDKKEFYFHLLQKSLHFEEELKKNNMETLMLRGVRTPHINKDEILNKIRLIDALSFL
ncbi:MAG: hypothetical protein BWK80_48375 [Desulfobacteraceae bacterium IS3]|nr:MAG: hypothetical protein BWK80_48375 [Desulfobacteraceae bacterium IS3]